VIPTAYDDVGPLTVRRLERHLTWNVFPPVTPRAIPAARFAVYACAGGCPAHPIVVTPTLAAYFFGGENRVTAGQVVVAWSLEPFVEEVSANGGPGPG
jgi:hypothetical protein